jgi:alpha-glucosidase
MLNRIRLNSIIIFTITFSLLFSSCSENVIVKHQTNSPDGKIELFTELQNGQLNYQVLFKQKAVLNSSALGLVFKEDSTLFHNLRIKNIQDKSIEDNWEQVWGEQRYIENKYNETCITLEDEQKRSICVAFRIYNDGLAFRYIIPKQENLDSLFIKDELSEFTFSDDLNTWFIPANYESYEMLYQHKKLSEVESANTPITFENNDRNIFVSIHEANLSNYAGMTLKKSKDLTLEADLVPWPDGIKVKTKTPIESPWRSIQISETAGGLIESNLILNLNEPNQIKDVSWIKPSKYIGIWWGMHLGSQTWSLGDKHGATTENMKQYIDFAANNNIASVLAEGWSTGWEQWGQAKAFDFVTAYPDFDLQEVAAYAKEKGVALIGHHETGGDARYYEAQLDTALSLYQSLGIHQLKTGYAGPIQPRGQYHHGQYMVNHYRKVLETAAKYEITINAHEPIKPTGIRRTYPNMMSREGARGMEWNAWSEGNPPEHHVILPFTRILAGPLDYTPGIFDLLYKNTKNRVKWNDLDKGNSRINTTLAKQLALFVVFYSPVQMASDLIENYENQPAFQFFKDVPCNWEESKVIDAAIGEHLTIVRKDWDSEDWYLGAVTNEDARSYKIKLDFLKTGQKYRTEIYKDGTDADFLNNPYPIEIEKREVSSTDVLHIVLAAGGGQAIRFKPFKK